MYPSSAYIDVTERTALPCPCGGRPLYDGDGVGHEWLTCSKCKFEIETYQARNGELEMLWNQKIRERSSRRYLDIKSPHQNGGGLCTY